MHTTKLSPGCPASVALTLCLACGPIGSTGATDPADGSDDGASSSSSGGSGSGAGSSSGSASASGSGAGSSSGSGSGGSSSGADAGIDASGTTIACLDTSTAAGSLTGQFGATEIAAAGSKSYFLQSNWWHSFSNESEDYGGLSFTVHNPGNASVPATDGAPMGFPSLFVGQYAGHATQGSNLPKAVSALTSVPTVFRTNNSTIGINDHNATYDVWFTQGAQPLGAGQSNPGAGGAYLMVWMFKPTDRQPRGSNAHPAQTVAGVTGKWDVWVDTAGQPPCISYVSNSPIDGLAFDLNDFIEDAVGKSYGVVTATMYLSIVFGGFEIWGGADGIQLEQFCVSVN